MTSPWTDDPLDAGDMALLRYFEREGAVKLSALYDELHLSEQGRVRMTMDITRLQVDGYLSRTRAVLEGEHSWVALELTPKGRRALMEAS
jgi:DNA-binding Lrp family transcriptional regulator